MKEIYLYINSNIKKKNSVALNNQLNIIFSDCCFYIMYDKTVFDLAHV